MGTHEYTKIKERTALGRAHLFANTTEVCDECENTDEGKKCNKCKKRKKPK